MFRRILHEKGTVSQLVTVLYDSNKYMHTLYMCMQSLAFKDDHKLQVFQNKVSRETFGT